jgi:hypothetical protein
MTNKIYPPNSIEKLDKLTIFLAGTIDQGKSEDWQKALCEEWKDYDVLFLNPRRPEWDENFGSDEVIKQVKWELEAMEKADVILVNILEDSESPISIAETYRFAGSNKIFVACPKKFYRYDNIKGVCEYYKTPHFESWEELTDLVEGQLEVMIKTWKASV